MRVRVIGNGGDPVGIRVKKDDAPGLGTAEGEGILVERLQQQHRCLEDNALLTVDRKSVV